MGVVWVNERAVNYINFTLEKVERTELILRLVRGVGTIMLFRNRALNSIIHSR